MHPFTSTYASGILRQTDIQKYTLIYRYHACIARIMKNNHRSITYYSKILKISQSTSTRKQMCYACKGIPYSSEKEYTRAL